MKSLADTEFEMLRLVAADGDEDTCPLQIPLKMKKLPRADPPRFPRVLADLCSPYALPPQILKATDISTFSSKPISTAMNFNGVRIHIVGKGILKRVSANIVAGVLEVGNLRVYLSNASSIIVHLTEIPKSRQCRELGGVRALRVEGPRYTLSLATSNPIKLVVSNKSALRLRISFPTIIAVSTLLTEVMLLRAIQTLVDDNILKCRGVTVRDPTTIVLRCDSNDSVVTLELWNPMDTAINAFVCLDDIIERIVVDTASLYVGRRCVRIPLAPHEVRILKLFRRGRPSISSSRNEALNGR